MCVYTEKLLRRHVLLKNWYGHGRTGHFCILGQVRRRQLIFISRLVAATPRRCASSAAVRQGAAKAMCHARAVYSEGRPATTKLL